MSSSNAPSAPNAPPAVDVSGLVKTYQSNSTAIRALDGIDLEVHQGEILALLGENGAGKTTLMKVLVGLTSPTEGSARLFSVPTSSPEARERVGYVPETNELPDTQSASGFLTLLGRLHGLSTSLLQSRVPEMLKATGLENATQSISDFSKGMKRRLSLAQALLHAPDLLLLDEPTSGLDPTERRRILNLLGDFPEEGRSVLLCSHVLPEVEEVCDRYVILKNGQVQRRGTTADITAHEYRIKVDTPATEDQIDQLPFKVTLDGDKRVLRVTNVDNLSSVLEALEGADLSPNDVIALRNELQDYY